MTQKRIMRFFERAAKCRAEIGIAFLAVVTLMVSATAVIAQTGGGATLVGTVKDNILRFVDGKPLVNVVDKQKGY